MMELALPGRHLLAIHQHVMSEAVKFALLDAVPVQDYILFQPEWHFFHRSRGAV
jgi:hypothetical protein